ncbi:MAG: hypothetical protein U9Q33_08810 [Campylobacterota bacterium]|nr:hypothetical protein [Campylobacterota bacterium]
MKKLLLLLIGIIFFQGCTYTVTHPIAPKSIEGRECVQQCESNEYQCKLEETRLNKTCKKRDNHKQKVYERCLNNNKNIYNDIKRYCSKRKHQKQCFKDQLVVYKKHKIIKTCIAPANNYNRCTTDLGCGSRYSKCFINCGGSYYYEKKDLF